MVRIFHREIDDAKFTIKMYKNSVRFKVFFSFVHIYVANPPMESYPIMKSDTEFSLCGYEAAAREQFY